MQSGKESVIYDFEDMLEARNSELAQFQPASRQTDADRQNDRKSVHQSLDKMLYLLVKERQDGQGWRMPQGQLHSGESLLQVCKPSHPSDPLSSLTDSVTLPSLLSL